MPTESRLPSFLLGPLAVLVLLGVLRDAPARGSAQAAPEAAASSASSSASPSPVTPPPIEVKPTPPPSASAPCILIRLDGTARWVTDDGHPCAHPPPVPVEPVTPPHVVPQYAPDSARSIAIVLSSIGFGVGGAATGLNYLVQRVGCGSSLRFTTDTACASPGDVPGALAAYGVAMSVTPNIPRVMMGDVLGGLLYAAAAGTSVTLAGTLRWTDGDAVGWAPIIFGFVVPASLGVVSLATTPHREDRVPAPSAAIVSIAPAPVADAHGMHGEMMVVAGVF